MAIRKVGHGGANLIGRYPSLKLGRMVSFESLLERDFITWLEFEPGVSWFAEQPLTLSYQVETHRCRYTPDFEVIEYGQHRLVECKPQQWVATPDNQGKFAAAEAWCAGQGWRFEVVTEVELRRGYRLANINRLIQFARYRRDLSLAQGVHTFLHDQPDPITLAMVMAHLAPAQPQRLLIPLLTLGFHHDIELAIDAAPLSRQTQVTLPSPWPEGGAA